MNVAARERWATRLGLILAAAGNAIGIGNYLRFPSQAAKSGGGAFIIPYLCSLLLFGIPMMWMIWWIGRTGGRHRHGSTPGMFDKILPGARVAKYLGVLGVAFPLVFCFYYTYAESWMLGYAWMSATGAYDPAKVTDYGVLLGEYAGELRTGNYFAHRTLPVAALLATFALNIWVLHRGVAKGIELLAKIAMPLLLIFSVILAVRVITLPPDKGTVAEGLAYVWAPDFGRLGSFSVWLAAAGQIFFTLSIGFGSLECYASYLRERDDVVLSGLTTASANEFVEVFFGSLIAIPATAVFLGAAAIPEVAGTFSIGLIAMPQILVGLHPTWLFGTLWYLLLFFAAFTSSVAVAQPVMAFFQDELGWSRGKAAAVLGTAWLGGMALLLWGMPYGMLDQYDFWAGTLVLVVFALIEAVIVCWFFGMDRFWEDIHTGADLPIPRIFRPIMKYVTPVCLAVILAGWLAEEAASGFPNLDPPSKLNVVQLNIEEVKARVRARPAEARAEALKKELLRLCDEDRADKAATFRVELDERGRATGRRLTSAADMEFADAAGELLDAMRYGVTLNPAAPSRFRGSFDVRVEARHVGPAVWAARAIMLAALLAFCALVRIVWKERAWTPRR